MLTTYSDDDGELVIRHYCGLGTEPVFKVNTLSPNTMIFELDPRKVDLHKDHESFVTGMKWVMNDDNSITFENTVMLDGSPTTNIAELKRVY